MGEDTNSDKRSTWLWAQQDSLTHHVRVTVAYHGKRERFYAVLERMFQAIAALTATSAFAKVVGEVSSSAQWFALAAAIASILPLVFGFAESARTHSRLKSSFSNVLAAMYKAGIEFSEDQLAFFRSQVAELEAVEPAPLGAVVIQCENEIATAEGKAVYPLRWWEKLGMHFYNFDATAIVARMSPSKE